MFNTIRDLIGYSGQMNIDSNIVQCCELLIAVFSVTFIWFFAKLLSFVCGFAKK